MKLSANQHAQRFVDSLNYVKQLGSFVGIACTTDQEETAAKLVEQWTVEELLEHHKHIARLDHLITALHHTLHLGILLRANSDPTMLLSLLDLEDDDEEEA